MSHGIKLFPTVTGRVNFIASNEGWTAESGSLIHANATSITAQTELHVLASTTLAGAVSPTVTLVGSVLPVRAECLYRTVDSSQTCNVSILDQVGTVIASTNFASSAYSTTYNDFKRAVVDVTAPDGVTGVQLRVCQGNDIDGEIQVGEAALNECVLLLDPDSVQRRITPVKVTHTTLSGRRVVDVLQRHYTFDYAWNAVGAATYDRLQEYFYRGEALRLDDGDVPDNQEVFPTYSRGFLDYANVRSFHADGDCYARTFDHSLQPSDAGFSVTGVASWGDVEFSKVGSTNGASITTSANSAYTYLRLDIPTSGSSLGYWGSAATVNVDCVSEVNSTGVGKVGFDVWAYDYDTTVWRRIRSVPRSGVYPVALDFRGSALLGAVRDESAAPLMLSLLFRTRATDRGSGGRLTLKNFAAYGNSGFDARDTNARSMGTMGSLVYDFTADPRSIAYVQLDSRQIDASVADPRPPTTLTAGADYVVRPTGMALAVPGSDATTGQLAQAQVVVRYTREFLVQIESLPESWYRTGAVTAHDRRLSLTLSTLRSSTTEELPL
jgi:hypothetical protein